MSKLGLRVLEFGIRHSVLLGLILALVGYWGPWVDHKAAALVLSGLDMADFVKLLPGVRAGAERVVRELFYLPPLAAALCLALLALTPLRRGEGYPRWARAIMLIVAALLALVVLPPYPFVLRALWSAELRWQFVASVLCLLLIGVGVRRRPSPSLAARLMVALALAGAILPLWQFFAIRHALDRIYGQPIRIGWGLWLTAGGFLIVALAGTATLLGKVEGVFHQSQTSPIQGGQG